MSWDRSYYELAIKGRALSKEKCSNLPKATKQRKWDMNPGSLALHCYFLPYSLWFSLPSLPPHLVLKSLLQHSPKFIGFLACAYTPAGMGSLPPLWGSVVSRSSLKTLPQVCGLLNKSAGLKKVSWETQQLAQPAGTWCGLAYRWRNLEGANKPHVLVPWEKMQGGHQSGGSECVRWNHFPFWALISSSVKWHLEISASS